MSRGTYTRIIEGLQKRQTKKISIKESVEGRKTPTLTFLQEMYGNKRRKGLNRKLALKHSLDTLNCCYLEKISDSTDGARIFRCALLHDALRESGLTESELRDRLDIDVEEMGILRRLHRGSDTESPNEEYIRDVLQDEKATIIKNADRISNVNDLVSWVKKESGFNVESFRITEKYLFENKILIDGLEEQYEEEIENRNHPLCSQYRDLIIADTALRKCYEKYKHSKRVHERVFKERELKKVITKEDFMKAAQRVKDLYRRSDHLQNAYPDFLDRFNSALKQVEATVKSKGIEYFMRMIERTSFDEKDYIEAYQKYIKEEVVRYLNKLQDMEEPVPKGGTVRALSRELYMTEQEVEELIRSDDKGDLQKIYEALIRIIESDIDDLVSLVSHLATIKFDGKLTYRIKEVDRAIKKFTKKLGEGKYRDFLDMDDLFGMRSEFVTLEDMIDFAVGLCRERDIYVFKVEKSTGLAKAYQGINLKCNYRTKFNYETQSVMQKMQVATDINHDVFYKTIMELPDEDKDAVASVVQVCLAAVLSDIFHEDIAK